MVGLALEMDAGEFYMLVGVLVKCFDWGGNQTGKQKIQNIVEASSRRTVADIEQAASRDCIRVDSALIGLQLRPARNKAGFRCSKPVSRTAQYIRNSSSYLSVCLYSRRSSTDK